MVGGGRGGGGKQGLTFYELERGMLTYGFRGLRRIRLKKCNKNSYFKKLSQKTVMIYIQNEPYLIENKFLLF